MIFEIEHSGKRFSLPFVAVTQGDDGTSKHFWSVAPSGDYGLDCATGRGYAHDALAYVQETGDVSIVRRIVVAMPPARDHGGCEIGFLSELAVIAAGLTPRVKSESSTGLLPVHRRRARSKARRCGTVETATSMRKAELSDAAATAP